jgi:hypothetical protein
MRTGSIALIVLAVLAVVVVAVFSLWDSLEGVTMGWRGYLALVLGVGFSLLVGGGLMMLIFFSARRGYDERVGGHTAADDAAKRDEE